MKFVIKLFTAPMDNPDDKTQIYGASATFQNLPNEWQDTGFGPDTVDAIAAPNTLTTLTIEMDK